MNYQTGFKLLWLAITLAFLLVESTGCGGTRVRDQSFIFYPAAPDTARYQFLTRIDSSDDVSPQGRLNKALLGDQATFHFGKPYGVTMVNGRIYVVDTQLKGIIRIDLKAKEMVLLPKIDNVPLKEPINISHDDQGNKYICDTGAKRVFVLDPLDKIVKVFGDGESFTPLDVAAGENYLYVIDKVSHKVLMLDRIDGKTVGEFQEASADSIGSMAFPTNLAIAPNGDVYVVDTMRSRVYCFNAEGEYLFGFGERGDWVGMFARPKGVSVDRLGNVLVVDSAFENVQVFDPSGRALTFIGGPGQSDGQMFLPAAVEIIYDDLNLFSDFSHSGVVVDHLVLVTSQFGPPHLDIYAKIRNVEEFAVRYPPDLGYKPIEVQAGVEADSSLMQPVTP